MKLTRPFLPVFKKLFNRAQPALVLGVGNVWRGDDGVGVHVARRLKERLVSHAPRTTGHLRVLETSGEALALVDAWRDAETVVVVDAARAHTAPGTIHRFDATRRSLPAEVFRMSTHSFGVAEAIELARALGQLPPRLVVYAIAGQRYDAGAELSLEVARAADQVVQEIWALVAAQNVTRRVHH